MPLQQALDYAHEHRDEFLAGFNDLLRIESISTDPAYKPEIERCADWIVAEMERIGLHNCRKIPTDGQPVVYGEWLEAGADKPTVLVYAHYDVQPVDPLDLWVSPPFEPTVRDGKLYARGSADDKCGVWGNLKAIETMFVVDGTLPVNIKVFFEGEEETGSPNMASFVAANKALLKADALLMCDGGFDSDQPKIGYSGRGIVGAEVMITGPDHDLHSGGYGGAVHNPIHMVGKIIGSFHDDAGRVAIPGYLDRVRALPEAELAYLLDTWAIVGPDVESRAGVQHFWGESIASRPERITALPTLDVNGVWGGYQGAGLKTVLPSKAGFKVTMRLVPDQDPNEIAQLFSDYVLSFATDTLEIQVRVLTAAWPQAMEFDGPVVEAVQQAYESVVGKRALLTRGGGSIPIGGMFRRELDIPMTQMGFGAGDNYHSPNEYLEIDEFLLAVDTAIHVYYNLAATHGA
jgi:acetylornithine deacetylase/succinyl-diaminopimelate desuccinylase-like protein